MEYTTVEGTKGSIVASKIHKIEQERCLIDPRDGQVVIMADGGLNNIMLNELNNGNKSFQLSWITVIYTNAGRRQIRVIDTFEDMQDKMEISLSSYHS